MSIEQEERLLDIEDHVEYLASLELADMDQRYIVSDIVQDIMWLVERVRQQNGEIARYQYEVDMLLGDVTK